MKTVFSPYQRFFEAISSKKTRENYVRWLDKFLNHSRVSRDSLGRLKKQQVEELVYNWIVYLKRLTEKDTLNPNSLRPMLYPIQLYLEQNDVELNWKRLRKYLPPRVPMKNQGAWTDEEIMKMLGATTSKRNKAIILFLASTGARIGALIDLKKSDIIQKEDGAMVWIYNEDLERYRTGLTPEAYKALKEYWEVRGMNGQVVTDEDYVFAIRNHKKKMSDDGARQILVKIQQQAGLRGLIASKKISSKAPNHAFRKRFELCLKHANIHSKDIEIFCGGVETGRDNNYYKYTESDDMLWKEFNKAVPSLTVNPNDKLKHENEKLRLTNDEYDNELKKKIAEIEYKYQNVIEELVSTAWHESMKNYFRVQLEGKGHPHTDPNYRGWMSGFIQTEHLSDMFEYMNCGDKKFIAYLREKENIIWNKNKSENS